MPGLTSTTEDDDDEDEDKDEDDDDDEDDDVAGRQHSPLGSGAVCGWVIFGAGFEVFGVELEFLGLFFARVRPPTCFNVSLWLSDSLLQLLSAHLVFCSDLL
jgi:hypothetical protein